MPKEFSGRVVGDLDGDGRASSIGSRVNTEIGDVVDLVTFATSGSSTATAAFVVLSAAASAAAATSPLGGH